MNTFWSTWYDLNLTHLNQHVDHFAVCGMLLSCIELAQLACHCIHLLKLELSFLGGRGGGGGICGWGGFWGEWHVWLRGKTSVNYYMICNKRVSMNLCYDVYRVYYLSERMMTSFCFQLLSYFALFTPLGEPSLQFLTCVFPFIA